MKQIHSSEEFVGLGKNESRPIIVDFFAGWCGPCRIIAPYFEQLSEMYKNVLFVKIDIDEVEDVAGFLQVTSLPTFILFKNGREVTRILGANKLGLENLVIKAVELK
jgi:thioredoxin 1